MSRSEGIPFDSLFEILLDHLSIFKEEPNIALGFPMSLDGGFHKPFKGFLYVLFDTLAMIVTNANVELRAFVAVAGGRIPERENVVPNPSLALLLKCQLLSQMEITILFCFAETLFHVMACWRKQQYQQKKTGKQNRALVKRWAKRKNLQGYSEALQNNWILGFTRVGPVDVGFLSDNWMVGYGWLLLTPQRCGLFAGWPASRG